MLEKVNSIATSLIDIIRANVAADYHGESALFIMLTERNRNFGLSANESIRSLKLIEIVAVNEIQAD